MIEYMEPMGIPYFEGMLPSLVKEVNKWENKDDVDGGKLEGVQTSACEDAYAHDMRKRKEKEEAAGALLPDDDSAIGYAL